MTSPQAKQIRTLFSQAAADTARGRRVRRTPSERAAEQLIDAIAVLVASEDIAPSDLVAFEDARGAVEKYRKD